MTSHTCCDGLSQPINVGFAVSDQQRHIDRPVDALAVPSEFGTMLFEHGAFACENFRSAPDVPVVGVLGGNAERDAFAAASNHQFWVRLLHRLGIEGGVGELVVAALKLLRRSVQSNRITVHASSSLSSRSEMVRHAGSVPSRRFEML